METENRKTFTKKMILFSFTAKSKNIIVQHMIKKSLLFPEGSFLSY